jgi:hypothetical protein
MRWPWCETCQAHVREFGDGGHVCVPRVQP